jgi:hypothetical protein
VRRTFLRFVLSFGGAIALALTFTVAALHAGPDPDAGIHLGATDIAGVVTSKAGPEAGVWVIATTSDLPTKYAKIVVTDDHGRYLIPDLPKATYSVWARGYGLVDSAKSTLKPGKFLNIRATVAPTAAAAAAYYPAQYWWSMITVPGADQFPGTGGGPGGNGIATAALSQDMFLDTLKTDGCYTCHQIGNRATRTIPAAFSNLPTSAAQWGRRITSGQAAGLMTATMGTKMGGRGIAMFADWTDRIKAGELPFAKPPRPTGVERTVVITEWDWALPTTYLHDEISTDKRNPTLNAYGKIYGSPEESTNDVPVLDPVHNTATLVTSQVIDPATADSDGFLAADHPLLPSAYWGNERIWKSQTVIHNPMFDELGNVWLTARIRPPADPAYCQAGGDNPSAKLFPMKTAGREAEMYDPKTKKFAFANLCFGTHHLQFSLDGKDILFFSPGGGNQNVLGWLDTKKLLATGDSDASQGWTPFIIDTNGNGKRDEGYTEPGQPLEPGKDARITGDLYGLSVSPVDGSVWGSVVGFPGKLIHVILGANPPATAMSEVFEPPLHNPKAALSGYSPRGMDIDRNGVVWMPLASGHLASFDRRKCTGPLNGPTATGQQCPEGWTLYPFPGPQFHGLNESGSAEASYFAWVDQFNTSGLGANIPWATGNASDSLLGLVHGKFVTLRVPYPIGFFAKNLDGRIDDAKAGWKGRGLWSTYGSRAPFHMETGKGQRPIVYHFQFRPNPLAD